MGPPMFTEFDKIRALLDHRIDTSVRDLIRDELRPLIERIDKLLASYEISQKALLDSMEDEK